MQCNRKTAEYSMFGQRQDVVAEGREEAEEDLQ